MALLGVQHVGRLIIPGDDPYVIPVNYTAVDGVVVFRTERRPVIDAIVDRPVVFEVDMFDDRSKSGWSVVVRGRAHDVTAGTDLDRDTVIGTAPRPWAPALGTVSSASAPSGSPDGCCAARSHHRRSATRATSDPDRVRPVGDRDAGPSAQVANRTGSLP